MTIIINNNFYNVKCLLTQKDISDGMMNKTFNETFDGLLFLLSKKEHSFWMKNCLIPLDIIFIDGNKISKIHHSCKPCNSEEQDCKRYKGFGDLVLELPAGNCKKYDISEGDIVLLDN